MLSFGIQASRKKQRNKPQAQGPLTCHGLVCKVFWDRGGGHGQPMVLLGILEGTREGDQGARRDRQIILLSSPPCEAILLLGNLGQQ